MKYIRMHMVEAEPMTRGDYNTLRGWTIPANENPSDEGYKVVYPDGYVSWCPKDRFEDDSFSADGQFGSPNEALLKTALEVFHDNHYCGKLEPGSVAARLVSAYYGSFVAIPGKAEGIGG